MAKVNGGRDQLVARLVAAYIDVRNSIGFEHNELSQLGIGRGGFMVLDYLGQRGAAKMSEIAGALRVTSASVTGITGNLVRDGYIHRLSDRHDRRVVLVEITDRGREKLTEVQVLRQSRFGRLLIGMNDDELRDLTRLIERLSETSPGGVHDATNENMEANS